MPKSERVLKQRADGFQRRIEQMSAIESAKAGKPLTYDDIELGKEILYASTQDLETEHSAFVQPSRNSVRFYIRVKQYAAIASEDTEDVSDVPF